MTQERDVCAVRRWEDSGGLKEVVSLLSAVGRYRGSFKEDLGVTCAVSVSDGNGG